MGKSIIFPNSLHRIKELSSSFYLEKQRGHVESDQNVLVEIWRIFAEHTCFVRSLPVETHSDNIGSGHWDVYHPAINQ